MDTKAAVTTQKTQTVYLVYLHGFKSSGKSAKAKRLRTYFTRELQPSGYQVEFLVPNYSQIHPEISLNEIKKIIVPLLDAKKTVAIMGSSLGGFYAQFLGQHYQLSYAMINPALNTELFIDHMGEHCNPHTGEKVVIDYAYLCSLQSLNPGNLKILKPVLVLMDRKDEVIDVGFAEQKYTKPGYEDKIVMKVYSGGSHDFEHLQESFPLIQKWLKKVVNHSHL